MQIRRLLSCLAVLLGVVLTSGPAQAQSLQTGSAVFFDHPVVDALDTAKYQLCVDGVSDATCADVAVLKTGTADGVDTFSLTLPATVTRGNRTLQVRAVGFGEFGASAGSNALAVRIIGRPGPPVLLRVPPEAGQ